MINYFLYPINYLCFLCSYVLMSKKSSFVLMSKKKSSSVLS